MRQKKFIKLFLSSPFSDSRDEHNRIIDLQDDIKALFEKDGIHIQFIRVDNKLYGSGIKSQDSMDELLRTCDCSLFLFKSDVSKKTQHEFEIASKLQEKGSHQLFVYFLRVPEDKKTDKLKVFQHRLHKGNLIWHECDNMAEVKFSLAMGIMQYIGNTVYDSAPKEKQLYQRIDSIRLRIKKITESNNDDTSSKIKKITKLYKEADELLSDSGFDKDKQSDLLFDYALFLNNNGLYRDAEEVYLRQISMSEELYGKEHEKTATSYDRIGSVYWRLQNYPNALKYHGKALEIRKKVLGIEHKDTAAAYNNVGMVYENQGNYRKALKYYMKALTIREKVLDKDHPATAAAYNNVGTAYESQDNYPKALEYYEKALEIKEKVLGKDHPSTATSYNNIGGVYHAQGDYLKALEFYRKSLEIDEKVLGKEHPSTAIDYNNIGGVYHAQGDYLKALEYYGKALEIDEKVLGKEHPDTATDYNNIGGVYRSQDNYPKALEYYGKALEIQEEVLGKEHPSISTTYNNIGSLYYQWGKYPEALEYLEKALKIRKAKLGEKHPNTKATQKWIDDTKAALENEK